jgi:hypothetical protein
MIELENDFGHCRRPGVPAAGFRDCNGIGSGGLDHCLSPRVVGETDDDLTLLVCDIFCSMRAHWCSVIFFNKILSNIPL